MRLRELQRMLDDIGVTPDTHIYIGYNSSNYTDIETVRREDGTTRIFIEPIFQQNDIWKTQTLRKVKKNASKRNGLGKKSASKLAGTDS